MLDAGDLLLTLTSLDVDVVLCGHKHVPYFWGLNGMLICNSGTAGTHRVRASTPPSWNELHVDASTIKVFVHYLDGRRELSVIFSRKTRALTRESFYVTREFLGLEPAPLRVAASESRGPRLTAGPGPFPCGRNHSPAHQSACGIPLERISASSDSTSNAVRRRSTDRCPFLESTIAYSAQGLIRITASCFANGSPTLPGLTSSAPSKWRTIAKCVCPPAIIGARVPSSIRTQLVVRRRRVDEVLVGARRAVEGDDPGSLQLVHEGVDERAMLVGQLPGPPFAHLDELAPDLVLLSREAVDEVRIPVPEDDRAPELAHAFERLGRLRADGDVPEAQDLVHALARDLLQHGVERGQIAVDVGDEREPHGYPAGRFSCAIRAWIRSKALGSSSRSATLAARSQRAAAWRGASSEAARSPARSR